jgi:DNA-binding CsgD family transcriptional regulator
MLEPIRQYAREKLEEGGEAEEVWRRHAGFFLALAEDAEPRLRGPDDVEWLERLEAEHDNLRTALSWALEQQENEWALQLAGALWHFWEARGHYGEGKRWLEESLKREIRTSADARAKALDGLSWFTFRRGDTDRAKSIAEAGLRLSHEAELTGAWVANFLRLLGWMEDRQGDHERAKELLEESLKLSQDADDKVGIARSLMELGNTSYALGDRKRAKELYEAGVVMSRESRYTLGLVSNLISMSYVLILEGDYERAKALNEEAAALLRERGYLNRLEHVLYMQGWVALLQDDPERARTSYEESLTLCRVQGDNLLAAESFEGLACVTVVQGMVERATILFGAAEALREAGGVQHTAEDDALRAPYHAAARSQLNKAMWEAMWAEGLAMSMEQAVEYAFSEEEQTPLISPVLERSPAELTTREMEVATLVARGLTNHQIAQELALSEHTVITHVRNILKKLNLRSRTQLTLWVTGRQLHS